MSREKFEKELERMRQQDYIIDTRKNHIYRLRVNRNGFFCITQSRFNRTTGVVCDYYIQELGFNNLDAAIRKLNEIKNQLPNYETLPSNTRLLFQR